MQSWIALGWICAVCSQLSNKKKRLEIRSGILEIIAIMFYTVVSLEVCYLSCMGVVWGLNKQFRDRYHAYYMFWGKILIQNSTN